jgi:hypothetical protein
MLKTKVVGEYTVSEAGPLEAARSVNFGAAYKAMIEAAQAKKDAATEDDLERLQALGTWSTHAPCISPRISPDEWLQIPVEIIAELRQAAIDLNPTWFATVDATTEKKSASKRRKSTNG